jgi:dihydrofolate reductase
VQISVNTFVSLDGVMQGPGGPQEDPSEDFDRGGWLVPHADADMGRIVDGWFSQAGAVLLGRTTYEMMRAYWTQVTDPEDRVATVLNTYPKFLVSQTYSDDEADWGSTTVVRGDVVDEIRGLKQRPGDELQVHGSWQLAQTLHEAGLVDVYRLLVFPTVVGQGKRLFDSGARPSGFRTVSQSTTSAGAIALVLEPKQFGSGDHAVVNGKDTWS